MFWKTKLNIDCRKQYLWVLNMEIVSASVVKPEIYSPLLVGGSGDAVNVLKANYPAPSNLAISSSQGMTLSLLESFDFFAQRSSSEIYDVNGLTSESLTTSETHSAVIQNGTPYEVVRNSYGNVVYSIPPGYNENVLNEHLNVYA